ncbi:MAG: DUF2911 domain-containing protein [Flavobacteriales bacterium]|jgi:hypothetical protein|nr:DUF2911 domain-containing protein [Flavobacteriales bacterium]
MPKFLKWSLIGVVLLAVLAFVGFQFMKAQTKKASPEETVTFFLNDLTVEITYSRPYKKGRAIFGALVPYGKVWRTGANEATTFTINKDIVFGDRPVKAGTYTLWTIPGEREWSVILNSGMYGWGVNLDGEAQRNPLNDVATVKVPVLSADPGMEQFTIAVEGEPAALTLTWDHVRVHVPITH